MKNKKWRVLLLLTMTLLIIFSMSVGVLGDTGNNVDYYDSGSSSSSHSGSGDGGVIDILFYLIFSSLPLPLKLIIIGVIIFFYLKFKKSGKLDEVKDIARASQSKQGSRVGVRDYTNQIEETLIQYDPNFSTGKFLGWSEEVFMTIQQAWTAREWDKIRPFEKEELYRKHQLQLQEYISNGTINVVERVNVNQTYLYKYERDKEYEYLTVYLQARLNDYIIDENTRQVVKGDRNKEYHMKYLLTFMRKTGVLTDAATSNMSTHQCPHCGAPLKITSSGQCEYCDTIITTGEHDWVLSDLDSIKNDTNLGRGGVQIR